MVFFCVAFINGADSMLRTRKVKPGKILLVTCLGFSLFFLRTVLGAAAIFALLTALLLSSGKVSDWGRRIMVGIWVMIAGMYLYSAQWCSTVQTLSISCFLWTGHSD